MQRGQSVVCRYCIVYYNTVVIAQHLTNCHTLSVSTSVELLFSLSVILVRVSVFFYTQQ